ncbi:S-layer homology domain-containing protein [Paenibacillus sp. HW567]|uniref:S-layer homology domain-containing protein n=1 Tax=Paenibacillus sp. HW567 TaxID=1034769 RepID=UPI000380A273|nr:S-layer homology domain-containing protein [Paenibacillus sp. HW567]
MKKVISYRTMSLVVVLSMLTALLAPLGRVQAATDTSAYGEVLVSDQNTNWTIAPGNTSRNLAVAPDGSIYAVYNGNNQIRVAKSITGGQTFLPSVLVFNASFEPEVAVSAAGTVYVGWVKTGKAYISKSTDSGQTFSVPIELGAVSGASIHLAVDGNYVYATDPNGNVFYYSSDQGSSFNVHQFGESYVFTDIHVDPETGNVIVQKDNPSLKYYISTDHGQSFGTGVIPGASVYYSVGSLSSGQLGKYLFVAGQGTVLTRMNLGDKTVANLNVSNNMSSTARSLSADRYGNVVTGFSDSTKVYFEVSQNLGANFATPVDVATTTVANAAINSTNGDVMFLYENSGKIYLKVYKKLLTGYKLYISNTSVFFPDGGTKEAVITVTNTSDEPLGIEDVKISGDFEIVKNTTTEVLQPGESGEITIRFVPKTIGDSTGEVVIQIPDEPDRVIKLNGTASTLVQTSDSPKASDITADATTDTVTVKSVPAGATVKVYAADGVTVIGTATNNGADAGDVKVVIAGGLDDAEAIKVSLTETDKTESPLVAVTAAKEVSAAPKASDITANATSDTVTVKNVPAGATVNVYAADGVTVIGTATNNGTDAGDVSVVIAAGLNDAEAIKVSLTETDKTESPLVAVTAAKEVSAAPKASDITANATTDTVTVKNVPAGVTVNVYAADGVTLLGTAINTGTTPGDVTVTIPDEGLLEGQIVKVSLTEGNKSGSPLTEVPAATDPSEAPDAAAVTANATTDTITVANVRPGVTVAVYQQDGVTLIGTVTNNTQSPADLKLLVEDGGLTDGQVIKVSFTEANKSESAKVEVTAKDAQSAQPGSANIVVEETEGTITVTEVPAGATVKIYNDEGIVIGTKTNTGTTAGTITLDGLDLEGLKTVKVTLTEPMKSESPATTVAVASSDEQSVNAAAKLLSVGFTEGDTWESVTGPVYVVSTGNFGTNVEWKSSKTNVIELGTPVKNLITGKITPQSDNESVILTATVSKGAISKTRTFLVIVKSKGSTRTVDTGYSRNVIVKDPDSASANIPITRINVVNSAGQSSTIDKVVFSPSKAEEIVANGKKGSSATVVIDEVAGDVPDELAVEVPAASLNALAGSSYQLNLQSEYATITLGAGVLQNMQNNNLDLFFHLVPLRNTALQAKINGEIPAQFNSQQVNILGKSLEIETNYSGYDTEVYVPFAKNGITPDTSNLDSLRVFVIHSDGEKVMQQGTLVLDNNKNATGISFRVSKFSTFTVVQLAKADTSSPAAPTEETIKATVGSNSASSADINIKRHTNTDGTKSDELVISAANAVDAIAKAKDAKLDKIQITIPDAKHEVTQTSLQLDSGVAKQLAAANLPLEIITSQGIVTIPTASLQGIEDSVKLVISTVKYSNDQAQALLQSKIVTAVSDKVQPVLLTPALQVSGSAAITGQPIKVIIPLQGVAVPANAQEREAFVNSLAVYAVDAKGTVSLIRGSLVDLGGGNYGLEVMGNVGGKYSVLQWPNSNLSQLFTTDSKSHSAYIKGYTDGTFKPDLAITRAELAALIARNLDQNTSVKAAASSFSDVSNSHWASGYIAQVVAAGIMKGFPDGQFHPNQPITRAEMALLSARFKQLTFTEDGTAVSSISDVGTHWAAGAIDAARAAGIMKPYADGAFAPAKSLTRAEAVTVINRLFARGPLNGVTSPTWSDVPASHWAFADIEEASKDHTYRIDNNKEWLTH